MMVIVLLHFSCKTQQKVIYLQQAGIDGQETIVDSVLIPDLEIKTGDILIITVNSKSSEAAHPFNLPLVPTSGESLRSYVPGSGANLTSGFSLQNYLVDKKGYIEYPVFGKIKVAGMKKDELIAYLKSSIYPKYIKESPVVLVRIANFKVHMMGEVVRPGTYAVENEKVSILEALSMAGDMTIYGNRNNILVVREKGNHRKTFRLDLTNKNLVNSPDFFLEQGDVVYVSPNDVRTRGSAIGSAETISISIVGTLISLTTLLVSLIR